MHNKSELRFDFVHFCLPSKVNFLLHAINNRFFFTSWCLRFCYEELQFWWFFELPEPSSMAEFTSSSVGRNAFWIFKFLKLNIKTCFFLGCDTVVWQRIDKLVKNVLSQNLWLGLDTGLTVTLQNTDLWYPVLLSLGIKTVTCDILLPAWLSKLEFLSQ